MEVVASRAEKDRLHALFQARDREDVAYLVDEGLRDPSNRFMAAKFLGELRAQEAVGPLIRLLQAADTPTRSRAAEALAKIGAKEAVPDLLESLDAENDMVTKTWFIKALGMLGDKRAVAPLCELLANESLFVRGGAVAALGAIGDPKALEPLRRARANERWYNRRPYKSAIRKLQTRTTG